MTDNIDDIMDGALTNIMVRIEEKLNEAEQALQRFVGRQDCEQCSGAGFVPETRVESTERSPGPYGGLGGYTTFAVPTGRMIPCPVCKPAKPTECPTCKRPYE